jgi:ABC-type multidrug transport system fused ATPase/permease subunit
MNEPQHPHFVLSDARYCHVLPEGLVVSSKKDITAIPAQKDSPDYVSGFWLVLGIAVLTFFMVMCTITELYVIVVLMGALNALMIVSLYRTLGFSQTEFVPRADINGVQYFRKNFGYDWFLVHYTGKNGKACKRRLVIYDSAECLNQALDVMKTQGLIK